MIEENEIRLGTSSGYIVIVIPNNDGDIDGVTDEYDALNSEYEKKCVFFCEDWDEVEETLQPFAEAQSLGYNYCTPHIIRTEGYVSDEQTEAEVWRPMVAKFKKIREEQNAKRRQNEDEEKYKSFLRQFEKYRDRLEDEGKI